MLYHTSSDQIMVSTVLSVLEIQWREEYSQANEDEERRE